MNRLKEPSTWAGLAAAVSSLAPLLPVAFAPGWALNALTGLLGLVAVALRERGGA